MTTNSLTIDEALQKHFYRNKPKSPTSYQSPMAPLSSRFSIIDIDLYTDGFPFNNTNNNVDSSPNLPSRSHSSRSSRSTVHFSTPSSPGPGAFTNSLSATSRCPLLASKSRSHVDLPGANMAHMAIHRQPRRNIRRSAELERQASDWMTGAAIALSETASEINGSSWLMTSTDSFVTAPETKRLYSDLDEWERKEKIEKERAKYAKMAELRALSRRSSRTNSKRNSPQSSQHGSRLQSRVSFAELAEELTEEANATHRQKTLTFPPYSAPDFVDENDRLESEIAFRDYHGLPPVETDEELAIRKLVRDGRAPSSWIARVMGWQREWDEENEGGKKEMELAMERIVEERKMVERRFMGSKEEREEVRQAPEKGGWADVEWLVELVGKVLW